MRNFLADFAPAIGICLGILAGGWCGSRAGVPLQKLAMPATFSTTSGRPWLVPLGGLPVKYRWLASLPALMVAVLLFFDQRAPVWKSNFGCPTPLLDGVDNLTHWLISTQEHYRENSQRGK